MTRSSSSCESSIINNIILTITINSNSQLRSDHLFTFGINIDIIFH